MSRRRRLIPLLAACLLLTGCADFSIVVATPAPPPDTTLPPTGFNHRFGNTPLSAKDGFEMERSLFAQKAYWEVALRTDPAIAGFADLKNAAAVRAARHAVTSVLLVVATEDRYTIVGLLASRGGDAGQKAYVTLLLQRVRKFGYDAFTSAKVLVYFTESDQHAVLTWSPSAGYALKVNDNDLKGTGLSPRPGTTPLPAPSDL